MEKIPQQCFICDNETVFYCRNLYTIASKHSDTPIYKFIEKFLGQSVALDDNQILCQECLIKLDDYDLATLTAIKVEQELIELLNRKQEKYMMSSIKQEDEITVDDRDGLIVEEHELVDDDQGLTVTCNVCCELFSSVSAMKEHLLRKHKLKVNDGNPQTHINIGNEEYSIVEDKYYYQGDSEPIVKHTQNRSSSVTKQQREPTETDDTTSHYIISSADEKFEAVFDNKYSYYIVNNVEIEENLNQSQDSSSSQVKASLTKPKRREKGISKGPFDCDICKKQFMAKSEFRMHMKSHEEAIRLVCYICGVTYKSKNALEVHYALHKGTSPYQCTVCSKNFTQKGALVRHMPIHTGELPYQCEKCGKQFRHCSSFHMHKLAHDNIREKKCTICGLQLRSNSHLTRHMRVHSGEKPHACPVCGQKFAQRYNMMTHYKVHQGITRVNKGHNCPICDMPFLRKFKLDQHMAHVHKNVETQSSTIETQYEATTIKSELD